MDLFFLLSAGFSPSGSCYFDFYMDFMKSDTTSWEVNVPFGSIDALLSSFMMLCFPN